MNSERNYKIVAYMIALFFVSIANLVIGQTSSTTNGVVSFVSSQNVYVKFDNTSGIQIGDTLFIEQNGVQIPALIVKNLSSSSCVCSSIGSKLTTSTKIISKLKNAEPSHDEVKVKNEELQSVNDRAIKAVVEKNKAIETKQKIDGRLSLSSYTNVSDYANNQRFRYNLSFDIQHLNNSKLSLETYLTFTHKSNEWAVIGNDINKALKIYSLALKYDLTKKSSLTFGRKINLNMANIGAVDGLQYEIAHKNFTYGALLGSRPDYYNYSLNPELLQVGAFVSHSVQNKNGNVQTSVAVFDQMNNLKTDRRFAYFQHSNSLVKKVDLFCSFEFDFYTMTNMQPTTTFDLTSTYISLRYKPWQRVSFSASYDARKNIYYYETFKNQIDSIIDRETRQGYRFQFNYRPLKYLNWGGYAGYRFQKSDPTPSINGNTYFNYSNVPWINVSATLNATYLQSNYMEGMIYGGSISRDFLSGKVYCDLEYRMVNYQFTNSPSTLRQDIAEVSISWRIAKKLMLSTNFEATLEKGNNAGRMFLNLTKRF